MQAHLQEEVRFGMGDVIQHVILWQLRRHRLKVYHLESQAFSHVPAQEQLLLQSTAIYDG